MRDNVGDVSKNFARGRPYVDVFTVNKRVRFNFVSEKTV